MGRASRLNAPSALTYEALRAARVAQAVVGCDAMSAALITDEGALTGVVVLARRYTHVVLTDVNPDTVNIIAANLSRDTST